MEAQVCNPSVSEAEAGREPQTQGQPGIHGEFWDKLGYRMKPYLKKQTNKTSHPIIQLVGLATWCLFSSDMVQQLHHEDYMKA